MKSATRQNGKYSPQVARRDRRRADPSDANAKSTSTDHEPSEEELAAEYAYYIDLSSAKDIGDFKRRIENAIKRLGFSEYSFIRLATLEDSGELRTIAPALIKSYYDAGLYEYDLTLQHANERATPFFRSTINDYVSHSPFTCDHTRCMRDVTELNKSFGYHDFYNVPVKAKNGNGLVLLTVTQRGLPPAALKRKVQECRPDLQLLCDAIDFVATRKFPDQLLGEEKREAGVIVINPKPLRVLDMLANNDLNITQVAVELNVNVVTANRHLHAVRKAFGVKTNYAAIKQGILNRLIEYK